MNAYLPRAYAFSRRAFAALCPGQAEPVFPAGWLDWRMDEVVRLQVLPGVDYPRHVQPWAEACNRHGVMATVVITTDDAALDGAWPEPPAVCRLQQSLGRRTADGGWQAHADAQGPLLTVHLVDAVEPDSLELLRQLYALPEEPMADAIRALRVGDAPSELARVSASRLFWRAYGRGLQDWLQRDGQQDLMQWPTWRLIAEDEFHRWPAGPLSAAERTGSFWPLADLPFAGIEVVDGELRVLGPLPVDAAGEWVFGPELKSAMSQFLAPRTRPQGARIDMSWRVSFPAANDQVRALAARHDRVLASVRRVSAGDQGMLLLAQADEWGRASLSLHQVVLASGACEVQLRSEPQALHRQVAALHIGERRYIVNHGDGVSRLPDLLGESVRRARLRGLSIGWEFDGE